MRTGAVAAALAMLLVSGCSAALAVDPPRSGASGATTYWDRTRLVNARPLWAGLHAAPLAGQSPAAHTDAAPAALRVGALFEHDASGGHFCTASVVASPGEDLLITAAHCINDGNGTGDKAGIAFIPGYRDGAAPYGVWTAERLVVAPQWADSADPDFDVGFIVLAPHDGENIQQVVGANELGYDTGYRYLVRVSGYPSGAGAPVTCVNWTSRQSVTQLEFDCDGFTDGTSGGPWVTQAGTIVGVIGGYQQGGDIPSVSYSAYLGSAVRRLYEQAIAD
jgi:V8-like Glu-specific endopeptidase